MFVRRLHVHSNPIAFLKRLETPSRHIASGVTDGIRWFDSHASSQYRPLGLYGVTLTVLGSGSAFPSPWRNVSCSVLGIHEQGTLYVFDCGEASQHQISSSTPLYLSCVLNGGIFISHFHGDHLFGLPGIISGVLLSYKEWRGGDQEPSKKPSNAKNANSKRLRIFGPPGLHAFVCNTLSTAHQQSVYQHLPVDVYELHPQSHDDKRLNKDMRRVVSNDGGYPLRSSGPQSFEHPDNKGPVLHIIYPEEDGSHVCIDNGHHKIVAAPLYHTSPCFGFVYTEKNKVHLLPEKLKKFGIQPSRETLPLMQHLKQGKSVVSPLTGKLVHPRQVQREGSKGRKIALFFDTNNPSPVALKHSENADLLLHEATLPPGSESRAVSRGHSTPIMAGKVAAKIRAKRLVLNHFGGGSPAMLYPREASMTFLGLKEAMLKHQSLQSVADVQGPVPNAHFSKTGMSSNGSATKGKGQKSAQSDLSDQFLLFDQVTNGRPISDSEDGSDIPSRKLIASPTDGPGQRFSTRNGSYENRHQTFQSLCPTQTTMLQGVFEEEQLVTTGAPVALAPRTTSSTDSVYSAPPNDRTSSSSSAEPCTQITSPSRRFPPRGVTYVQEFAYPSVQETVMATKLSEDARTSAASSGWNELKAICARDFMTIIVPPPSEDWGVRGPIAKQDSSVRNKRT